MHDEKIFKITLITIIELIGLFIASELVNPEVFSINQIDNSKIDNQIQVTSIIKKNVLLQKQIQQYCK